MSFILETPMLPIEDILSRLGAQPSIPDRAEVEQFMRQNPAG